ncbi:hypothetical protein ACP70R_030913 [Stipagrostis hirtigluma subsp. patula]
MILYRSRCNGQRPSRPAEHDSPIQIEQNATTSRTQGGNTYHRYTVTVTNRSNKTAHELHIGISNSKLHSQVWGLDKAWYNHVFPCSHASPRTTGSPATIKHYVLI